MNSKVTRNVTCSTQPRRQQAAGTLALKGRQWARKGRRQGGEGDERVGISQRTNSSKTGDRQFLSYTQIRGRGSNEKRRACSTSPAAAKQAAAGSLLPRGGRRSGGQRRDAVVLHAQISSGGLHSQECGERGKRHVSDHHTPSSIGDSSARQHTRKQCVGRQHWDSPC